MRSIPRQNVRLGAWARLVWLLWPWLGRGADVTAPAASLGAEGEFRAIKTLGQREVPVGWDRHSDEASALSGTWNLELHERGLAFWAKFPADPLRWDVWMMMNRAVFFTREVVESGETKVVRDPERWRAWSERYQRGVEELLAAPDAGASARATALGYLLGYYGRNWRSRITTPDGQTVLAKMTGWFERWEREFPDSPALINGVRAMAEVLDAADPARCQRFLYDVRARYRAETRRDRDIRGVVEGRLKLLLGQAYPVWIRLAALDGHFADTQEYRGRMVLISLFPLAWSTPAEFLRGLHEKYHARGLENIHVTGGDAMEVGAAPRSALETAWVAEEKQYPWRVVWDRQGTFGEFARTMGLNTYPTWLLLSRDGRFVAQTSSPREIVAAIDRELLIKMEPEPPIPSARVAPAAPAGRRESVEPEMSLGARTFTLEATTAVDPAFHAAVAAIDARLRAKSGMTAEQTAVGLLDLRTLRLALVRPDAIDYAASVPKIGILLAWFQAHPEAATALEATTRHELGQMIKVSDNEMATKYSTRLGIARVQDVLGSYGLYDPTHGGGIWFGKHYGQGGERLVDPVGGHSHAATVRQLLRFYLLLEQGKLVSPEASAVMREIFASPEIAHLNDRFVKGLAGRGVEVRRKSGSWEAWSHDTAVVTGPGRHYIIVGLTQHAKGADYLEAFAAAVDDVLASDATGRRAAP